MRFHFLFKAVLVTLLVFSNFASAFISSKSFRIKGMGQELLDFTHDEYSNFYYNPHYLNQLEGKRLYSNLSNLSSVMPSSFAATDVNLLKNTLYPTNIIGGITDWQGSKVGVLYASSGFSGNFRQEHSESSISDGVLIRNEEDEFKANGSLGGRDVNLFWGAPGYGVLLKFSYFSAGFVTEEKEETNYYDDSGRLTHRYVNNDEYGLKNKNYFFGLSTGRVIEDGNSEISMTGGLEPAFLRLAMIDVSSHLSRYFESANGSSYFNDYDDDHAISVSGWSVFFNYRKRYETGNDNFTSKVFNTSLSLVPFSMEKDEYEHDESWNFDPESPEYCHTFNRNEHSDKLSGTAIVFKTMLGYGREMNFLDNNTKLIFGAKLKYFFIRMSASDDPSTRITTYQRIYPNALNDDNDFGYILTRNNNEAIEISGDLHVLVWNFPIGFETRVFKKLTLRMGSNALIPMFGLGGFEMERTDRPDIERQMITHGPDKGAVTEDHNLDDPTVKETDKFSSGTTNVNLHSYSLGLGWEINDNLTLDILHFSRLTDLGTWWFSLGIKLD